MRFTLTGKAMVNGLWIYRGDLMSLAHKQGHFIDGKVLWDTAYLVTDTPDRWTQKRRDANNLHVPIISTEKFIDMMGGKIEFKHTPLGG